MKTTDDENKSSLCDTQEYWKPKLERNVLRDAEHIDELTAKSWRVLTVWECEIKDLETLTRKLKEFLSDK